MSLRRLLSLLLAVLLCLTMTLGTAISAMAVEPLAEETADNIEETADNNEVPPEAANEDPAASEEIATEAPEEVLPSEEVSVPEENLTFEETTPEETEVNDTSVPETETEDPSIASDEEDGENQEDTPTRSLLPLTEIHACLVLNGYSDEALKTVKVKDILSNLVDSNGNAVTIPQDATEAWLYVKDSENGIALDSYNALDGETTLDMSRFEGLSSYIMELIVGYGGQLNQRNTRYIITVYISNEITEMITYDLYYEHDGIREKVVPEMTKEEYSYQFVDIYLTGYVVSDYEAGREYYLGINSAAANHPDVDVEVYLFMDYVYSLYGADAEPITGQILNQDMTQFGSGYKAALDQSNNYYTAKNFYAIVYSDHATGATILVDYRTFVVVQDLSYIRADLYYDNNGIMEDVVAFRADTFDIENMHVQFDPHSGEATADSVTGIHGLYYMLKEGYSADAELYCKLFAHGNVYGDEANSYVTKAVVGLYSSLDEAAREPDIKDQLIPVNDGGNHPGYKANYNSETEGQYFTVFFADGNVWRVNVRVLAYDPQFDENYVRTFTEAPIIGDADPWFRITGAKDSNGNDLDTYIVENGKSINMDTVYGYGYQTVFINSSEVDLTSICPTFWIPNTERVKIAYVNGHPYEAGDYIDASDGPVQFTAIIDGHQKNYLVSFVKRAAGPELFVFGPESREVFLDEYFEYKHDILIANLGDAPLTGLHVELDATNCKLDDYWTVGGTNNDTLAPFTETSSDAEYGELANLAKIRLIPDGDGDITGTLTIYADGQEPVVINLSGQAKNPAITTAALDDAVKYVPYSQIITTDNMYDWTDVSFTLTGELPEGVEFYPATGEIYGVPQETGTFNITVEATFTSDTYTFESSTIELTLTVLDNTDTNVYNASDVGYTLEEAIGVDSGEYHFVLDAPCDGVIEDQIFWSEGDLGDFQHHLYLNGKELIEGVDYIAESGSTKITIYGETFEDEADPENENTIAAEFRDEEGELHRTAQNFYIEETGHDYDSGSVTTQPTCTASGIRTYVCKICGATRTETIPPKGHFPQTTTIPAGCTTDGSVTTTCAVCHTILESQVIPATGHAYDDGTVTTEPSCTANGAKKFVCANCGDSYTNDIPALGHSYDDGVVTKQATCTEDGETTFTCIRCGDSYTNPIKATGHNYTSEVTTEPTEDTSGERTYTCVNCGDSFTEEIPPTGDDTHTHEYDDGVVTKEPTCTDMGEMTYTCTICGATKTEAILPLSHSYEEESRTNATCAEDGEICYVCSNCGDSYTETVPMIPHDYQGAVTTAPTCTEDGEKTFVCSMCGDSYTETVEATGHTYDEGKITVAPTTNATGIRVFTCVNCGKTTEEIVPAIEKPGENGGQSQSKYVSIKIHVIDADGEPIPNLFVELHSTPMSAMTNVSGNATFRNVGFGSHTLSVKDADGNTLASLDFNLVSAGSIKMDGNMIMAYGGGAVTLTVQFDNGKLTLISAEATAGIPRTGDTENPHLWIAYLTIFTGGLAASMVAFLRKRRENENLGK